MQAQQEPKNDKSLLSRENADDEVIRHFEETEGSQKIIADVAEGSNSDLEQLIHMYTELTRFDDERKKMKAKESRCAIEARSKDAGREPTAAQEHGKKVCFMEEEKEAQEARERQEQFMKKRRRAQEARAEEWREQEKKRCEEGDDERVQVVPTMEAGGSYLQTTDPKLRRS